MTIKEQIDHRERQLLVNACLYYKMSTNLISDYSYDKYSFDLDRLIKKYPDDFKKSVYYKDFVDFNPSSGYYLHYNKPEIVNVANRLVRYHKNLKDTD